VLIKRLDRLATGWNVVATSVVALSLLIAANVFASHFYLQTGGYGLLDLAGGRNALTIQKPYTPEDAYALMAHWGVAGRHDQLIFTLTLDAVVPATTWLFLALALLHVTRPFATARWRLPFAVLLPAAYLFSDYGENAAVLAMVSNFPSHLDGVAAVGGALWLAKTLTSDIAVCAIVLGLISRLLTRGALLLHLPAGSAAEAVRPSGRHSARTRTPGPQGATGQRNDVHYPA
jgi:hypothetical protein